MNNSDGVAGGCFLYILSASMFVNENIAVAFSNEWNTFGVMNCRVLSVTDKIREMRKYSTENFLFTFFFCGIPTKVSGETMLPNSAG